MTTGGTESPQQFGKYLLLERIAMGGMAEIFRAKKLGAEGFEKELVIKRVLPHFTEDESFITMFKDEARIAANLNHANICQVFEFDELDGSFYLAMEYIPGQDLKRVLETGVQQGFPLTTTQIAWIGAQVAAGLHYAHTKEYNGKPLNIVHRDVTPHNVMLSREGDVKLMDFGIAKAAARSTRTQAGTVKGKCAYMSPEQARGKDLDGRSDVFALGIVMWEALSRDRLFLGETEFETLSNVLKRPVADIREHNAEVPDRLKEILDKSLARDRDDRYESAAAMERDLLSFFYQQCDPNKVLLGETIQFLFEGGPRPELGATPPPPEVEDVGVAETAAMPSIAPHLHGGGPPPPAGTGSIPPIPAGPPALSPQQPTLPLEPNGGAPPHAPTPLPPPPVPTPVPTPVPAPVPEATPPPMSSPSGAMAPLDASEPGFVAYTGQIETGRPMVLYTGIAGGAVLLLAVIAFLVFGGNGEEAPPADPPPTEGTQPEEPPPAAPAAPREIRIEVEPASARIYIDADDLSRRSPLTGLKRRVGSVLKLKVRARKHKTVRQKVTIEAGDGPQVISIKLEKK